MKVIGVIKNTGEDECILSMFKPFVISQDNRVYKVVANDDTTNNILMDCDIYSKLNKELMRDNEKLRKKVEDLIFENSSLKEDIKVAEQMSVDVNTTFFKKIKLLFS
jgi:phosphodiesterase/alkaline phosphatase D-like protein